MARSRRKRIKTGDRRQVARRREDAPVARAMAPGTDSAVISRPVPAESKPAGKAAAEPIAQTPSWRLFGASLRLWRDNGTASLIIYLMPAVLMAAGGSLAAGTYSYEARYALGLYIVIGALLLAVANVPAGIYLQLRAIRGEKPGALECYRHGLPQLMRIIGAAALLLPLFILGLAALIVPGIMLLRRYLLTPYYIIDDRLGIRDAMERSAADSKPVSAHILGTIGIWLLWTAACFWLLVPILPPYGLVMATLVASWLASIPALRFKEVALRLPATGRD